MQVWRRSFFLDLVIVDVAIIWYESKMTETGVVLLNMGGPSDGSEVKPFLKALFADPDLIRIPLRPILAPLIVNLRAPRVKKRYAQIPGGSPLMRISEEQAGDLEDRLNPDGEGAFVVRVGMRYTPPTIEQAVVELIRRGCRRIIGLSMYPQYCGATTGSSLTELRRVLAKQNRRVETHLVDRYFDHPGYLGAVAETVRDVLGEEDPPFVLFSAHGVPMRLVEEGDPYVDETRRSVAEIAERLGLPEDRWKLAFQSRVGPVTWVGPFTDEVLVDLSQKGVRHLVFVPISFTVDNLETLYDIDIVLTPLAKSLGMETVKRAPALNRSPAFIEALAELVGKVSWV